MKEFFPLVPDLEPWFDTALAELPVDVRARVDRDFPFPGAWDGLGPGHRRSVAEQRDLEHEPANEEAATIGWDEEATGWEHWRNVHSLTTREFCALLRGYDPRSLLEKDRPTDIPDLRECIPDGDGRTLKARVADDMRILNRAPKRFSTKRRLVDWIRIARDQGLDVPAFMTMPVVELTRAAGVPFADGLGFSIRCVDGNCTMTFEGETIIRKTTKGLRYVEQLARTPGKPIGADALYTIVTPAHPDAPDPRSLGEVSGRRIAPLADPDAEADADGTYEAYGGPRYRETIAPPETIANWKRRRDDLVKQRVTALEQGKTSRAAEFAKEIKDLSRAIGGATTRSGLPRFVRSDRERTDRAVGAAIRNSIAAIKGQHPGLGDFLRNSIRCGNSCRYWPRSNSLIT